MAAKKKSKNKKKSKEKSRAKKVQARAKSTKRSAKKSVKKAASGKTKIKARARKTAARAATTRKPPAKAGSAQRRASSEEFGSRAVPAAYGDADSQGLSNDERADSESVSELLEEGNTFEAGIVEGVERADDADEKEVRTREMPEDDVPEEYLDEP